jgi:6-phosphogluconolactonase
LDRTRRRIVRATPLAAALVLAGCATAQAGRANDPGDLFFIGTQGNQIQAARLDTRTGTMTLVGPVGDLERPTWLVRHPQLPILYSVSEVGGDGKSDGKIVAFHINRGTGTLTRTSEAGAGGGGTTNLWFDAKSRTALAANFGGATVSSIAVRPDGSLGALASVIKITGSGPHRRQQSPHPHGVTVDPSGRYALLADLGVDKLFVYPLDPRTHKLSENGPDGPHHFALPPGAGPRHFVFHPNGRFVYLLGELTAQIFALRWDAKAGRLSQIEALSLDTPGYAGNRSAAEVRVSRDGRFAYSSNRGESAIVVHAIDPRTGMLSEVQRIKSGGENPWTFTLHPDGRWMVVANQRSDKLNLFRVDPRTGLLAETGASLAVTKPVNITFDRVR